MLQQPDYRSQEWQLELAQQQVQNDAGRYLDLPTTRYSKTGGRKYRVDILELVVIVGITKELPPIYQPPEAIGQHGHTRLGHLHYYLAVPFYHSGKFLD